jgi:agmatine deiminase
MPAEWEPHAATWIAWPRFRGNWPGKFAAIGWAFAEMVRRICEGELVRIIVNDKSHEKLARSVLQRAGVPAKPVQFFRIPTDRGWTRDMGPMFVRRAEPRGKLVVADFRFNGWANYRNWQKDDRVAGKAAKLLGFETIRPEAGGKRFVLEGGAIDVNGRGTLLTTEECLLDNSQQPRNPHLTPQQINEVLAETLGATNVFYLSHGVAGDDTGGHVDDVCRFVNPKTVVVLREQNPQDVNYRALCDARERLKDLRLEDGSMAEVIELPAPEPLYFNGKRLPASYANFYIANAAVIVPTFNDPSDRVALGILGELFPDRKVVGIHAIDLVLGRGTLHCLTQQQPS